MPAFGPVNRRELVAVLQRLGFSGPYSGGRHQFMQRGNVSVALPNPHQSDIGRELLARILRQAGVSREEWEQRWFPGIPVDAIRDLLLSIPSRPATVPAN